LPIQTLALRAADTLAGASGLLDRPFAVDALIGLARRRTGLTDFGETSFVGPLRRFLAACHAESSLGLIGRSATKWDVVRFLSNLLRLQAAETADPGILAEPIARPVFITGLPRSGTTLLHRLMMTDPVNRAPAVWETIYPYPDRKGRDRRVARVARQLRTFELLAPEFRALHPLNATSPQECSEITAHVFRSLRFDTNYDIPSYRNWLDADVERHTPAYRFHRRFLQHLQHQDGAVGRWVLKCPEHLFALQAIRTVYPDARLIVVHRDPVKVLLSVARLTEVLRRPFTRRLDRFAIGRTESARWLAGAHKMMEVGDDAGLPEPVCHVHHLDLVSDPVSTVAAVYRHFGMSLPAQAVAGMERYMTERPNGGYGPRDYHFEDHGLDADVERDKFRPYMLRFGVTAEALPAPRSGAAQPGQRTPAETPIHH